MKTIEEIKRHRDHLLVCMQMPCDCRKTGHEEKCIRGAYMMKAVAETISWVLGQNDDMQPLVDRMAKDVSEFKQSN